MKLKLVVFDFCQTINYPNRNTFTKEKQYQENENTYNIIFIYWEQRKISK